VTCAGCGEKFAANDAVSGMGGSASPGTFFWIAAGLAAAGTAGFLMQASLVWIAVPWLLGAFVALQCFVALTDCWNAECPKCGRKNRVWPWSL
jgi:hypothetical protein